MMHSRAETGPLFQEGNLDQWLAGRMGEALRDLSAVSESRLLATPVGELVDNFSKTHQVEMVAVDAEAITVVDLGDAWVPKNDFGRKYASQAHRIVFSVPFTGEPNLFRFRGTTWISMYPRAKVGVGTLTIPIVSDEPDDAAIKQKLNRELDLIRQWLGGVGGLVADFNRQLASETRTRLDGRKKRLLEQKSLVAGLGFPVRPQGQQSILVPLPKKRILAAVQVAQTGDFQPEPAISSEDYEAILHTMQQMTLVIERDPGSFAEAEEETIRTHFLVPLNGYYQGAATGETFNGEGKTDILIRAEGKNVFIAEFKFWRGPDSLSKAIDQLMGYLSWRDTKCAIVLLVRGTEMSTVLSKVPEVVRRHALFKRQNVVAETTWFRAVLQHPGDKNREALITVMTFHVPRPV